MSDVVKLNGAGPAGPCSDLAHPAPCSDNDARAITPEEAEMIGSLAEIIVDSMIVLQQKHGLAPKQMLDFFNGNLKLNEDKEVCK